MEGDKCGHVIEVADSNRIEYDYVLELNPIS
jgi:hypothetical protein